MNNRNWLIVAVLHAAVAVMLGAFGAHGLKTLVAPQQIETFKTGVQYHFYHALGIALAVIVSQFIDNQRIRAACRLFTLGIACFSGSLYLFTFFEATGTEGSRLIGLLTPLGGIFFILGWLSLALGIWRGEKSRQ